MLKKVVVGLLVLVALLAVSGVGYIAWIGAWNIVFPSTVHETEPPLIPDEIQTDAILVFTKTNGFRHNEGIAGGVSFMSDYAAQQQWPLFHTENSAVFNADDLSRFALVVFLNTTGDSLSEAQRSSFEQWLTSGGSWLGVHAAGDGSHAYWPWYTKNLIGVEFTAHPMDPQFQSATVSVEVGEHPLMAGLPVSWQHEEEWYSWKSPPSDDFTVLASIDEDSYDPTQRAFGSVVDLRMGYHPVVWGRCVGQGRAVYSALGHTAEAFAAPQNRRLLENALGWLLAEQGQPCEVFLP